MGTLSEKCVDAFGTQLEFGDIVMVHDNVYSKGGRGTISFRRVVGYERYIQTLKISDKRHNEFHTIEKIHNDIVQFFGKNYAKKGHQELLKRCREENIFAYFEGVSPAYVTKVSERFYRGWQDGSIFTL